MNLSTAEWSHPDRIAEYLAREMPHRRTAEDLLVEALPERVGRVLDLGCGDGRLGALVLQHRPLARLIALDNSPAMLERARQRFGEDARVRLQSHDLARPLAATVADEHVDAVVSGLAIHHLPHAGKRRLFAEVRALLRPGGLFADLDLVTAPSPQEHVRFRAAIGREVDDPTDVLADLEDQLRWLRHVGYEEVDCRFKWRQLALFTAFAPPRSRLDAADAVV